MYCIKHIQNLTYSVLCFFSSIWWHIQSILALLKLTHAYWDIMKVYSGLFRYIQHPVLPSHISNLDMFWALLYLEPEAYLKSYETLTKHIQNPALGHYSAIFRHIQNFVQRLHTQKPGILKIFEYSEPFHNCIFVMLTKIYQYSELWHI